MQIQALKSSRGKYTAKKTRGWLDVSGSRMCLLDISGGWVNIVLSMILFAGEDTARRVLFEAGHSESFSGTAIRKGILDPTVNGFNEALNIFSESGFGDFMIRDLAFSRGYVRITCLDTFEAWAFLQNKHHSETAVCHYTTGILLSFMEHFSGKQDLISVEKKCIARGDDECEFLIGTEAALKKMGIAPPEWGMTIKEKAEYLENLLIESARLHEEIKESEQKVMESKRLAAIGQLSANIAHEIRNPLSAIKTNIQILSKNLNLQGFDKRRLEIASGEILRLDRILEDTLDFAAPVKVNSVDHDVREVIDKCILLLSDKIEAANIVIVRKMAKSTPTLAMDYEKMQQAVLNLILNAIDAMPNGGTLELAAGFSMRLGQKAIRVEIKDSGRGIPPENMGKIFEPFFSTKTKGAGLGLPNVKKIIEAHNGRIQVTSRPHRGVRIRLLLPLE